MSFNWGTFKSLLEVLAPAVMTASGVPPQFIPLAVHGIQAAESMGLPGADKKASVVDLINTAAVGTAQAIDKPGLTDAVSKGIDTTIAVMNMFSKPAVV